MAKPLKQWKSYTQQLQLLESRGMIVTDNAKALNYLERVGYYRLSGYWYPFRQIDVQASKAQNKPIRKNEFVQQSNFENIVDLYIFDKKLRLLALDALERIELAVRVDVAHLLGKRDRNAHQIADCLHGNFTKKLIKNGKNAGKTEHAVWLEKYNALLYQARREPFIEHHKKHYEGCVPVWVAIEIWDFGLLSRMYSGLKYQDQQCIAEKYNIKSGEIFAKWLRSLNFVRNVAAHHSRLWNINILELSPQVDNWQPMNNARPFFYFCIIQHLLKRICPNSTWSERFKQLLAEFPQIGNGMITLGDFGIAQEDCQEWELWQIRK